MFKILIVQATLICICIHTVPIQSTIYEPQGNSGFNLASASASLPQNMLFERFDGRKLDEIEIVTEKIAKDDTCWETEECEYCKDDDDSPGEERRRRGRRRDFSKLLTFAFF